MDQHSSRTDSGRSGGWRLNREQIVTVVTNAFLMNSCHGLGRRIYNLKPDQISHTFMRLWADEPTNLFAVFLVRLSIALFFLRLMPPKKIYLWTIRATIAALVISVIYVSVIYSFKCKPVQKFWRSATPGTCLGREVRLQQFGFTKASLPFRTGLAHRSACIQLKLHQPFRSLLL